MTSETLVCSVLLPERFGAYAPCTFGTQPNGFLQSPLPVRFFHSERFIGLYLIDGRMLPQKRQLCNPQFEFFHLSSFFLFPRYFLRLSFRASARTGAQRVDKPILSFRGAPKGTCFAARNDVGIRNLLAANSQKSARIVRFEDGLPQPVCGLVSQ